MSGSKKHEPDAENKVAPEAKGVPAWPRPWPPGLVVAVRLVVEYETLKTVGIEMLRLVAEEAREAGVSRLVVVVNLPPTSTVKKRLREVMRSVALARMAAVDRPAEMMSAFAPRHDADLVGFEWEVRERREFKLFIADNTAVPRIQRMTEEEVAREQLRDGIPPTGWRQRAENDPAIRCYGIPHGVPVWIQPKGSGTWQCALIVPEDSDYMTAADLAEHAAARPHKRVLWAKSTVAPETRMAMATCPRPVRMTPETKGGVSSVSSCPPLADSRSSGTAEPLHPSLLEVLRDKLYLLPAPLKDRAAPLVAGAKPPK